MVALEPPQVPILEGHMRLAVIGSRTFTDYKKLVEVLDGVALLQPITQVVSGGAPGADRLAEKYGKDKGIAVRIFPAEWTKYGKSAGFRRNADIIKNCDGVVAFWDGVSKGTAHSISLAEKAQKEITVIRI